MLWKSPLLTASKGECTVIRPLQCCELTACHAFTLVVFMAAALMVGCVQTPLRVAEPPDARAGADRVLVMPPAVNSES